MWCSKLHIQGMKKSLSTLFGKRVKALRISTGMSQEAFADSCGFARSYMSRVERGGANVSLDAIDRLAKALRVEPWQLLITDSTEENDPELLVPYAADGTCFHPGLASSRDGSFGVGDKTAQKRFFSFSEALEYLRIMEKAKWRRPNSEGNWSIVVAVKWDKLKN
ncbi:anaerobic benzoate catabolism transcriptional regulator [Cedecea neteri]|uniref:Anaerobic benzoate catabolism transcriptional regulator n=2 Tax=Cedecea neteri TaxID=158822 RepID=A0A2X3J7W5_9ENTR|nr:anaerobic benzoate catabolism transcriptional regulator [Cedecea neteri]